MAKTQEELFTLKKEYEAMKDQLQSLTEDELKQVIGGFQFLTKPEYDESSAEIVHRKCF